MPTLLPRHVLALGLLAAGCGNDPPGSTYYERNIQPILTQFCAGNVAGCHKTNADDPYQFAAGNLDVTSFENVQKRRDVLEPHGAYPVPLLLIKAVGQTDELGVNYRGEFHPLEIQHVGGPVLQVGSASYLTLLTWTENGATANGLPPVPEPTEGQGDCSSALPVGFDPQPYLDHAEFDDFKDDVQPKLHDCSAGNCHGAPQADFHVTCGDTDDQIAYNFSQVWAFVDDPVDNSQVLKMPLPVGEGGEFHTGGAHFTGRDDPDYVKWRDWAAAVGRLEFGAGDPGKEFFADNVQPLLLTRGCSFEACHSPDSTNDFKVRAGSQGFFSAIALQRNYDLLREEFLAFEVHDVRRGRAVAKTILPQYGGIAHRGGPVLETPGSGGSDPSTCDAVYDPATASAYCTLQEWNNIERARMISDGTVASLAAGTTVPIVWVDRDADHVAGPLEFDTYQAGSDLLVADATIAADGSITVGGSTSLLTGCAGYARATADVRSPDVSADGQQIAFAMRTDPADPLGVWTVDIDGGNCTRITPAVADVDGIKIHNFDPAWSPDDEWIVFASTRSDGTPKRSRKLFLPQSDIWRMHADGSGAEQMTFLTNSEVSPQWMREGRVTMTTEKVSAGFYQLSGRR
ncbi:MAG TPA: hypothetical protein VL172_15455, partial [Kofleriaceae bacterium]|nr:hypothetical protein [Kofleriaceae bacterium]